jgi:gentisate 1,2-dioxygenase
MSEDPSEAERSESGSAEDAANIEPYSKVIQGGLPPDYAPAIWRYDRILDAFASAEPGEMGDRNAEKFDIAILDHADLEGGLKTSPEMVVGMSRIEPGGYREPHRHNAPAINFIIQGSGYSVIDGERIEWEQHDTLLVPTWDYHEHYNDGDEDVLMFTVLTMPQQMNERSTLWQEKGDEIFQMVADE